MILQGMSVKLGSSVGGQLPPVKGGGQLGKIRIVIPCYNEERRLPALAILAALGGNPEMSLLFVNDGSTDDTGELLDDIRSTAPDRVAVLSLAENGGKAEAVRQGMLQSLAGQWDAIGYWDADLATPLEDVAVFYRLLQEKGVDLVLGSRVALLGRQIERSHLRHYVGRIFATGASLLLGIPVYDTQCGAKLFRDRPELRRVFGAKFKSNWTFDVELLARLLLAYGEPPLVGCRRWYEHPLDRWLDVAGSKVGLGGYLRSSFDFALLWFYLRTPARRLYEQYLDGGN